VLKQHSRQVRRSLVRETYGAAHQLLQMKLTQFGTWATSIPHIPFTGVAVTKELWGRSRPRIISDIFNIGVPGNWQRTQKRTSYASAAT
jgi:hypothetical protein